MKRLLLGLGCVLAVLAAAWVGLLAWQGRKAEAELRARLQSEAEDSSLHVLSEEYERGWLESRATWVLGEAPKDAGPQAAPSKETPERRIVLEARIDHGPLPGWRRFDWRPALAHARSRVWLESAGSKELSVPTELPPLRAETRVLFDGSSRSEVSMKRARLELDGKSLHWQGLEGESSYEKAEERFRMLAESPGLTVKVEEKEGLALEKLILYVESAPGPGGLPLGEERFAVESLRLAQIHSTLRASGLEVVSSRSVEDGLLDLRVALDIAELARAERGYGPLSFEVAVRRLDASAASTLWAAATAPDAQSDATARSEELLPELLRRSPELEGTLDLGPEAEAIRSRVHMRVDGEHPALASGETAALLAALRGRIEVSVPYGFVERALAEQAAGTARAAARAEAARNRIYQLVSDGVVALRDGRLELTARYEGGRLAVNGRRMNPHELLGLAMQGMKGGKEQP